MQSNPHTNGKPPIRPNLQLFSGQAPYSQEAEEAVIGAVIINPDAFLDVATFLNAEDFYVLRHIYIWEALARLDARREPIDYLTIQVELSNAGHLNDIGGPAYLTQLMNNTPTSMHAEIYGRLVQRAAIRRRLLQAADEIKGLAFDEELTLEKIEVEAEARFSRVWESALSDGDETWREILTRQVNAVEGRIQHPDRPVGLPTGFADLDDILVGLQRSDLIVVAGRPGQGKTSLLLNIIQNAMRLNARVLLFTLEMGRDQICDRIMAAESGLNLQKLRVGSLDTKRDWPRYVQAVGRSGDLPLWIDDTPAITPLALRRKALRVQRYFGLDLIVVDYLQLMSGGAKYEDDRVREVSYVVRELKALAKELHLPVLSAAQLSRAVEQRQDKRPQLSDLRESGEIEQAADVVAFLYRDVVYNEMTEFPNRADIIVAKHRNGPTGVASLHFDKALTKFSDSRLQSIDLSALGDYSGGGRRRDYVPETGEVL